MSRHRRMVAFASCEIASVGGVPMTLKIRCSCTRHATAQHTAAQHSVASSGQHADIQHGRHRESCTALNRLDDSVAGRHYSTPRPRHKKDSPGDQGHPIARSTQHAARSTRHFSLVANLRQSTLCTRVGVAAVRGYTFASHESRGNTRLGNKATR